MKVPESTTGPFGTSSRRRRSTDADTARRMLDAATARVNRTGLTVSLDHIGFEEVIREAGVSRSTAYRRWPYKDLFYADLLRELARGAAPAGTTGTEAFERALTELLAAHADTMDRPETRRAVLVEIMRRSAEADFAAVLAATEWHTYLALQATFLSLPDGSLRDEIRAALAASDRGFVDRIARSWAAVCEVFGYRLRPGSGVGFPALATMVTASLRGSVTMALADAEPFTTSTRADPVGTGPQSWTVGALALAATALAYLEPDPDFVWDAGRVAGLLGRSILGEESS